ncbi:MAG: M56 family metallopeptidase [Frankia sp.]|nr:M56 family metallopeptidase [Frankia sp.]
MTTAAALALFAAVLAWPVPRMLAAARWTHRCPRAAIVLWQAIGLAGGVSALLAVIAFTVAPLSPSTPDAIATHARNVAAGQPLTGLDWLSIIGLVAVAALAGRLFGVLAASTYATLRHRHRHRHLVDLTGRQYRHSSCPAYRAAEQNGHPACLGPARHRARRWYRLTSSAQDWTPPAPPAGASPSCALCDRSGLRILEHPVAVAYCVPGVRHARVVVSRGLLTTLGPRELDAVLAHEDAHVSGRHDLVIQPFIAWQQTFPFLHPAREATAAVSLLVEMLADDTAARRTSGRVLARALAQLGVTRALVPTGAIGITGSPTPASGPATAPAATAAALLTATADAATVPSRSPVIARIVRLLEPPRVPWWLPAAAYTAAAAVLASPAILLAL